MLKRIYNWMGEKIHSPYADPFLGFLFFIEALFFIPVDPILILYCLEKRKRSFIYAAIATISSVIGGIAGYAIGLTLWQSYGQEILQSRLVSSVITHETFAYIAQKYELYAHWAILIAGFSPIPYKAATLSAGFCKISFIPFLICSIIARGTRFFLIAFTIRIWGKQIKQFIDRYFNLLVTLSLIIIATIIWLLKK